MTRPGPAHPNVPSDPELSALFEQYANTGDRDLRNELILRHRWLAQQCSRRFARRSVELEDLLQVAEVGLLKAVERFDPDYGVQFATFAIPTVLGELRRHFRDATWAVGVSRRYKDLCLEVGAMTATLAQRLGRDPSVDDIAAELGVSPEEVAEAMVAGAAYQARSLDRSVFGEEHDTGDTEIKDLLGIDEAMLTSDRVAVRAALRVLPDRERRVVFLRFFEDLTQQDIADVIGVSQVHVSRLLRSALARLRATIDARPGVEHPLTSSQVFR
jgi:RNA polymerase sigma-B factor